MEEVLWPKELGTKQGPEKGTSWTFNWFSSHKFPDCKKHRCEDGPPKKEWVTLRQKRSSCRCPTLDHGWESVTQHLKMDHLVLRLIIPNQDSFMHRRMKRNRPQLRVSQCDSASTKTEQYVSNWRSSFRQIYWDKSTQTMSNMYELSKRRTNECAKTISYPKKDLQFFKTSFPYHFNALRMLP